MRQSIASSSRSTRDLPRARLLPLAMALASASLLSLQPGIALAAGPALPSGPVVVRGQANVNTVGNRMTVTNSDKAILNWKSFSIGARNQVRFDQPSAASQVLNRVVGNDPSAILGNLSSNGKVWLLNPNGVLFGQNARVDVAGLVASTLRLNDTDWLAGRYSFTPGLGPAGASVVNQGELRSTLGGRVALLAGEGGVRNEGLIDAPGGQVLLAAGKSIDLIDTGAPNLTLRVTAPQGEAMNLGSLSAPGGRIDVQAAVVNQQGIVRAGSLARGAAGEIVLSASESLETAAGSVTSADGAAGGQVTLDAGAGTLLSSGEVSARGGSGGGGRIKLLGAQVGLRDGAVVDASGGSGGGEVLLGGGQRGLDTSVPNASAAYVAPGASLHADALQRGDGGRLIVWSDKATRAYGDFSARGGPLGGDGGLIETSGGWLDARPHSIDASAAAGRAGQWLLDPNDLTIIEGDFDRDVEGGPNFTTTNDNAIVGTITIENALNRGNSVTLETSNEATTRSPVTSR